MRPLACVPATDTVTFFAAEPDLGVAMTMYRTGAGAWVGARMPTCSRKGAAAPRGCLWESARLHCGAWTAVMWLFSAGRHGARAEHCTRPLPAGEAAKEHGTCVTPPFSSVMPWMLGAAALVLSASSVAALTAGLWGPKPRALAAAAVNV